MPSGAPASFRSFREPMAAGRAVLALAVTVVVSAAWIFGWLDSWERSSLDLRFRGRGGAFVNPKILLVEADEASVRQLGRWPWDRKWHATAVQALKSFGARSVGMNMLFSEEADPETDLLLVKLLQAAGNVYLAVAVDDSGASGARILGSLPALRAAARGEGHVLCSADPDGVLRAVSAVVSTPEGHYWHLGLLLAMEYLGADPAKAVIERDRILIPLEGNAPVIVPLDSHGRIPVNWPGRWKGSFRRISFYDLLVAYSQSLKGEKSQITPPQIAGSLCLVGVTATGLYDVEATPLERSYPALGVTAAIANGVIERRFLHSVGTVPGLLILVVLSAVFAGILFWTRYPRTLLYCLLALMVYEAGAFLAFLWGGWVLPVVYPAVLALVLSAALAGFQQAVISSEKNRLMKLATTDPLTALFNIAHFKRLLSAELESLKLRSNKNLCLLMADADHFKSVNDTWGHAVGDDVLRSFAEVLKTNARALDVAARYGGEEFIVMLPGAEIESAVKVAEKMRELIAQKRYATGHPGKSFNVSASFGVTNYHPGESPEDFLKRADEALYAAKKSGRNCVYTL